MAVVNIHYRGADGSGWHLTAGPAARPKRLPNWLDTLLVRTGQRIARRIRLYR
ncbi:hypothetical protein [Nocardia sp. CA-145437]|uniref:hypothetical protein n=1 Tax=Nocardia sp. CA-145437 TaxID=3239980 RepID=UPI003D990BF4